MNRKLHMMFVLMIIAALALVACGGSTEEVISDVAEQVEQVAEEVQENAEEIAETVEEAVEEVEEAAEEVAEEVMADDEEMMDSMIAEGGAGYIDRALAGEFEGTTVTMLSVFSGEDEIKLNASVEAFEAATGIDLVYEGTSEFEAIVTTRVEGGDAADIIGFPQPGLLANFSRAGFVVDLNDHFERSYLEGQYINSWLDMATFEGPEGDIMGGVWHRTNGKSQVWYPKAAWEEAGYPIPTTHAEMLEVMDQIVADGDTPWCIGIESGAATGWTATDWTEEYMLRTTSLENYDAWVRGDLDFDSPEVKNAIETWSEIWFNDDYVLGGREQIATTFFGDSPTAMFEDPPRCWMHKQGSFITSFFPEGTEPGVDYDFFYLPPVGDEFGRPYLVAGDIYAAFSDRPEVLAMMEYFSRGESLRTWMESGGAISPHRDVDLAWHGDPIEAAVGEAIANATSVRFDASDLMPGEVGAGTFWTGMTSYVNNDADLDTILAEIEASWPEGIVGEDASEIEAAEEEEEAAPAPESITNCDSDLALTVWADDTRSPVIAELGASFEEAYGVCLEVQQLGFGDIRDQLAVAGPAGEGPDIIIGAHDWLGQLATSGLLAELDLSSVEGDFAPASIAAFQYDGAQYGLPYAVENVALFYNQDLVDTPPTTWSEVKELATELEAAGTVQYGYTLQPGDAYHFMPIQTAFGGYVFGVNDDGSYNPEDVGIDSEGSIAAAQWLEGMLSDGQLSPEVDWDGMHTLFETGETAMIISGPWALQRFRDSGVNYGIAPLPGEVQDSVPFLGVQGFMVSAFSEDPLLAQAFLTEFVATEESMAAIYASGDRASAHLGVLAGLEDADVIAFGEAGANGRAMPAIPEMGSVWGAWGDAITLVFNGDEAADVAFTNAGEQIRTTIAGE